MNGRGRGNARALAEVLLVSVILTSKAKMGRAFVEMRKLSDYLKIFGYLSSDCSA